MNQYLNFSLEGKVALVTGASYGIGFAIASAFAEQGATICFNDINQELVDKGLASYAEKGIKAHGYVCDVTDEPAVQAMVATIAKEVGTIDILVNNAGIIRRVPMHEMEAADFRRVIDIDLNAPFIVSKAVLPAMMEKGHGKIINICSMMSELGRETVSAYAAAKGGLSVLLIEKNSLGGVCLNEGCIPTKTLLYSAKTYDSAKHASKYAVNIPEVSFDLPKIIARKSKVVRKLVLGVKAKLTANNVTIVSGEAQIIDKNTVRCGEEIYEGENLILCTGSETFIPPIPGVDAVNYWTHRDALDSKELPASLAIVGGGVIGMEFASFFNSLGVQVTVVEMMDEILGGMDKELSALLRAEYTKRGIKFLLSTRVVGLSQTEEGAVVSYENAEGNGSVIAEKLLMSVGRRPVAKGFGLENLNLEKTERGAIRINEKMQTSVPGVYVCGDLTGFSLLAHTAVREAEVAVHSILGKEDAMSYRAIPGVVYTNPEIAGVGETEESASTKGINYQVIKLPMAYSGRFVAENEGVNGVCKVLLDEQQRVIGSHVLGNPASEIITLAGTAIELGLTAAQWKKIVFPHPTVGEIFREVL